MLSNVVDFYVIIMIILSYPVNSYPASAALDNLQKSSTTEKHRLFIRDVEVGPGLPTLPVELLIRTQEEVPIDILSKRGLTYDDPSSYLDIKNWNPNNAYKERRERWILDHLLEKNFTQMLVLALSYTPSGQPERHLILTGRLTDLALMHEIITDCQKNKDHRQPSDNLRICEKEGNVFQAVSIASIELNSFDEFREGLRSLFAKLLHIPQLRFKPIKTTYDTGDDIDIPLWFSHNDGSESQLTPPDQLKKLTARTYHYESHIVELPHDYVTEVCANPDEQWSQLSCDANIRTDCERRRFDISSVQPKRYDAYTRAEKGKLPMGRIMFLAAPYTTDYLVQAQIFGHEGNRVIASSPIYRCVSVRPRNIYVGLHARFGHSTDNIHGSIGDDNPVYPAAALPSLVMGLDVTVGGILFSRYSRWLPFIRILGTVGFTSIGASIYPCPSRDPDNCQSPTDKFVRRLSTSSSLELRGQMQVDLVRIWRLGFTSIVEYGVGAEYLSSRPNFDGDGWYGIWMVDLGGGIHLVGTMPWRSWASRVSLAVTWQVRSRFGQAVIPRSGLVDAAGVPDGISTTWITVGYEFSP